MKKDLNIEETDRVWNGREWMTRSEWRAWCEKMKPSREELARLNMKLQRLGNNPEALAQMRRLHEAITAREATGVSPLPTDADRQQWHDRYFSDATARRW